MIYIDPDGLFETKKEAKSHAKKNGIKTGFLRRSKVKKQSDGSYAIENKKAGTSTQQLTDDQGGNLGVMTGAMVAATDVMGSTFDKSKGSAGAEVQVLRDGSEKVLQVQAGAVDVGPGSGVKGYKYVKTIGKKFNVFQKTVKSKKLGGQARAVYTKVKNKAGKTIRFFKDAFKRDGRHYERANKHPNRSRSRKLD